LPTQRESTRLSFGTWGQIRQSPDDRQEDFVNKLRFFALTALAVGLLAVTSPRTEAQVSVSIGAAPNCPYGYYDYAPYACAPYGYYGPEWFNGGVFVGSGPWFHGGANFHGKVNNRFDPQHGYKGPAPRVGEKPKAADRAPKAFKGNEDRDGRGHVAGPAKR
jgi:hypothetical protein